MDVPKKVRLQAYLDPVLAKKVRDNARANHRPESWEVERLLLKALESEKAA